MEKLKSILKIRFFFQIFILVLCYITKIHAQYPDWFDKVNILSRKGPSVAPTTGGTNGFSLFKLEPSLRWNIEYRHSLGQFYIAGLPFTAQLSHFNDAPNDSFYTCIDLEGNPIKLYNNTKYQPNLHHPAWQDSLIKWVKYIIDLGADGVYIDGYFPNVSIFRDPGGSFDEFTMNDFRTNLETKYDSTELANYFDIQNIKDFHFGNWIKDHGQENNWNEWPPSKLSFEFLLFEWQYAKQFLAKFKNIAKEYATLMYNKNFLISENTGAQYYFSVDIEDFITGEFFYYKNNGNRTMAASYVKAAKSFRKPVVVFPEVYEIDGVVNLPQFSRNMIKYIFADVYASGGISLVYDELLHLKDGGGYVDSYEIDLEVLKKYAKFILNNPYLFENLQTNCNAALIYSYTSFFNKNYYHYAGDYLGMSKLLIEANIQHDVLFFSDNRISNDNTNIDDLNHYNCIIIPNVYSITNSKIQILLDYLQNGGVIIADGNFGTHDENNYPINRPAIQSLTVEGTQKYGNGYFIYFTDRIGQRYFDQKDEKDKNLIVAEINKYNQQHVIIEPENSASVFVYEKKENASKRVLHIVNYNYNPNKDEFKIQENITVKLRSEYGSYQTNSFSPDLENPQIYFNKYDSGYVSINVPSLESYNILFVDENKYSPVIESFYPVNDTTIVEGDSLIFTINVNDKDENILFYDWQINGEQIATNNGSKIIFKTSYESQGIDTVMVIVSDGKFNISKKWYINIRDYIFPKIIFDETHNQTNTISFERAKILNPDHPDWIYFGILNSKLENDFVIDRYESGVLTTSILQNYDALILAAPREELSNSEINDILTFISNGGGLFFITDWGQRYEIHNQFLQNFGIQFQIGPVWDSVNGGNTRVDNFVNHDALSSTPGFKMNWGGTFEVTPPGIALGNTLTTTWLDLNGNKMEDINEPKGPFAIVCASSYGKGNIFYVSDNSFHDDAIKYEANPNDELFINALKWLTKGVNQIPTGINDVFEYPKEYYLSPNYPNPFNSSTTINFQVSEYSHVKIIIFDILGRKVRTLLNRKIQPGTYKESWNCLDDFNQIVSSGVYLIQIEANNFVEVKKAVFLK